MANGDNLILGRGNAASATTSLGTINLPVHGVGIVIRSDGQTTLQVEAQPSSTNQNQVAIYGASAQIGVEGVSTNGEYGVHGISDRGGYGVYGESNEENGIGVGGAGNLYGVSGSGNSYGVVGVGERFGNNN